MTARPGRRVRSHRHPRTRALPLLVPTLCITGLLVAGTDHARARPASSATVAPTAAPAEFEPYSEKLPGGTVTLDMVPIAGGTFRMGSPPDEPGHQRDESPQHEVTVGPFWMSKFEITWDQYDRYAFANVPEAPGSAGTDASAGADAVSRPTPPYADESFGYGKGRQPAISMTWHAAMEFCRWLSQATGKPYRLPTEAEWEYAARGGTTTPWSFGADPNAAREYAWYADNSDGGPKPVGGKKPNPFGLFDMHGNVAEWVLDQYDEDAYASRAAGGPVVNPVNKPGTARYPHVVRGGSWDDAPAALRSAARRPSVEEWSRRDPQQPKSLWWHTEATFVGFRVVRPVDPGELADFRSRMGEGEGN